MAESDKGFEGWAILELMGHRRLGGLLSSEEIAGAAFIRIDVPHPQNLEEMVATQFYAPQAVYAITPTTEDVAREIARGAPEPVNRWDVRSLVATIVEPRAAGAEVSADCISFDVEPF
jgi:hypothetical protein